MSSNAAATDGPTRAGQVPNWLRWSGRVFSVLAVAMLVLSAAMKLSRQPRMLESLVHKLGYPEGTVPVLGAVELSLAMLYAFPRTAPLGAVLLTGYLGGAVASHVRIGEAFTSPLVVGILVWAGLVLRERQVRALLLLSPKRA